MEIAKAQLNNLRMSPRKVRLVTNLMRGKRADDALALLPHVDKKSASVLEKLLKSALANARNAGADAGNLFIRTITVDGGATLFRRRPTAHGRAFPIRKRTSKVMLVLEEKVKNQKSKAKSEISKPEAGKIEKPIEKPKAVNKPRVKKDTK